MTEDEKFVRDHWEWVLVGEAQPYAGYKEHEFVWQLPGHKCYEGYESKEKVWSAAAEFTRERLEQIRQVEEEFTVLDIDQGNNWRDACKIPDFSMLRGFAFTQYVRRARTMSRLESILADLKRGMK